MKKYIIYIILVFTSFIPILKVNAVSTSTELYTRGLSRISNAMEWAYNTSNDYLLNLKSDYTSYSYYFTESIINSSLSQYVIGIKICLFQEEAFFENLNSSNFIGLRNEVPITKYYNIRFYWNDNEKKAYTDNTFSATLSELTNTQIVTEVNNTSNTDIRNIFSTSSYRDELTSYGMYFTNMKIANISNSRKLVQRLWNEDTNSWENGIITNPGEVPFSYISVNHALPNYLTGYKPITITPENRNTMLSGLTSGSIYIPYEAYEQQHGTLGYFDIDVKYQPYTSIIEDVYLMPDNLYYRQDFDLSTHPECEFMAFYKYLYLEGEDTLTYTIYVPNSSYDSTIVGTLDEENGKYDYTYEYKDENGDIQEGSFSGQESDFLKGSPLLGDMFKSFSSNTFGLTSVITAPLVLITQITGGTCQGLTIPIPYTNSNMVLPCMYDIYEDTLGSFFDIYQMITFGIIAYWVVIKFLNLVKDFKNPDHDEIEVLEL